MSWHTFWRFWRHEELFDVMAYLFWHHNVFEVMTNCFDVMSYFWLHVMTSWRTFWCIFGILMFFYVMTHFFDVVAYSWWTFWRHDNFFTWSVFDFMTNFFTSQRILKSWQTFWSHDGVFDVIKCFDVMTVSWCHYKLLEVMTCFWLHGELFDFWHPDVFLTWWQTFWRHDKPFGRQDIFLT